MDYVIAWLDRRHAALNRAARECYALRDEDPTAADDFQAVGDQYFSYALAVSAEFEA